MKPPLPADLGRQIHQGTCAVCWGEWMTNQTIFMNENALTPVNPEHYAMIVEELRKFLSLPQASAAEPGEE